MKPQSLLPDDPTAQQIYDHVATHLLMQGQKSLDGMQCRYRAGQLACAVGCEITDEYYRPEMEGKTLGELLEHRPQYHLPQFFWQHSQLLRFLQVVHDNSCVSEWPSMLSNVAAQYGLSNRVVTLFSDQPEAAMKESVA